MVSHIIYTPLCFLLYFSKYLTRNLNHNDITILILTSPLIICWCFVYIAQSNFARNKNQTSLKRISNICICLRCRTRCKLTPKMEQRQVRLGMKLLLILWSISLNMLSRLWGRLFWPVTLIASPNLPIYSNSLTSLQIYWYIPCLLNSKSCLNGRRSSIMNFLLLVVWLFKFFATLQHI